MTFDEWWKAQGVEHPTQYETAAARKAFEAATLIEREACAKVCDIHAENMARHGDTELAEQSRKDAVAIRARSNA